MEKLRVMLAVALPLLMGAGVITKHNDNILAYDQAVARCHERGMDWKRVQPLVVQDHDGDLTTITKVVQVHCTKSTAKIRIQLVWAPVSTADHYEVHIDGKIYISETSTWSHTFTQGAYTASVITVDGQGNKIEPITVINIPMWNSQ